MVGESASETAMSEANRGTVDTGGVDDPKQSFVSPVVDFILLFVVTLLAALSLVVIF